MNEVHFCERIDNVMNGVTECSIYRSDHFVACTSDPARVTCSTCKTKMEHRRYGKPPGPWPKADFPPAYLECPGCNGAFLNSSFLYSDGSDELVVCPNHRCQFEEYLMNLQLAGERPAWNNRTANCEPCTSCRHHGILKGIYEILKTHFEE